MSKASISKEQFIDKMIEKYGGFDFDGFVFKASSTILKCNKCGKENSKSALRHIACTCSACYSNMSQRSNTSEFIKSAESKFGNEIFKFEDVDYINAITPVKIFCKVHADYFYIKPNKFLTGKGCPECNKNKNYSTDEFNKKVKEKYGDYLDISKTLYVNHLTKVTVYCNIGKHYWTVSPKTLLKGKTGCGICTPNGGKSTEHFISDAQSVHGNLYDYKLVQYNHSNEYVDILCKEHGIFKQTPQSHLTGRGCPKCGKYGYQPNNPGYFYVQKLSNNNKIVYKYGITGDMERRVNEQNRHSDFEHEILVQKYFEDGEKPLLLEKFVKKYISSGVVTPEELPSGFTETFEVEFLETVLEIVNTFE